MRQRSIIWVAIAACILGLAFAHPALEAYAQTQAFTGMAARQHAGSTCIPALINGGFEDTSGWSLPRTAHSASYSQEKVHSGTQSLRAGILHANENVFSYSSGYQTVQIPTGVQSATLSLWWYPLSSEGPLAEAAGAVDVATLQAIVDGVAPSTPLAGDRQYAILTNEQNSVITRLLWTRSNAHDWEQATFDLTPYAGRTLRIHLGVYNDGVDGVTAMYVDDASLQTCQALIDAGYLPFILRQESSTVPAPTPTPTPTPVPEPDNAWTDPAQAIEVFSPVANGLYHSQVAVNGFSQTFEGTVNIRLTGADGQVLAERTAQGGSVDGFDFFDSYVRFSVSEQITATLEVFETSAVDGSEIHKVQIPVVLLPGQRVIDLDVPKVGDAVCNPVLVSGYSNTFEATLAVALDQRNGTELALTTAMGGNLGVYADFSTTISHTVPAPQAALVGAFEESPAGFGRVDYTRVPVTLNAAGIVCPAQPGTQRNDLLAN